MLERLGLSVGHTWAPTLAFVSSENTVTHSELASISFKTFSSVSHAHGTKRSQDKIIFYVRISF